MVPPKALNSELEQSFRELQNQSLDVNTYAQPIFDVVFDLMTVETGIAGIATRLLDGQTALPVDIVILQKHLPIEGHSWMLDDRVPVDLEGWPEVVQYVQTLERTRLAALRVITNGAS